MSRFSIRTAMRADVEAIVEVVNAAYRPTADAEGWTHESHLVSGTRVTRQHLEQALEDSKVLVAECDGSMVGTVQIQREGRAASIGMLAVLPLVQTAGLGKILLAEAEHYSARVLGVEQYLLKVVEGQQALLAFYERRGYKRTGEYEPYPVSANVGSPLQPGIRLVVLRKDASDALGRAT